MRTFILSLTAVVFLSQPQMLKAQQSPTEEEIFSVLKREVEYKRSSSISSGLFDKGITHYVAYGKPIEGSTQDADEQTIYEIASVTKLFVATLLSDFILKGKIGLNDPIVKYLPDSLEYRDPRYREVTVKHLATHTSGLPSVIGQHTDGNRQQYHKNLSYEAIFSAFEQTPLLRKPGIYFEYSNINMSVIAFILCNIEDKDLETLMKERIFDPFRMKNTTMHVGDDQKIRFATAYLRPGVPVENWEWGAGAGAGGLRSTTEDMILFLKKLFYEQTELSEAAEFAIKVQHDSTMIPGTKIGLGWFITEYKGATWVGHSGTARGFKSFVLYDITNERAAVVLSNSPEDVSDIGFFLFDKDRKTKKYKAPNIKIPDEQLTLRIEGRYLVTMNNRSDTAFIYKRGECVFVYSRVTGEDEMLYRKGETFFFTPLNIHITFSDLQNNKYLTFKGVEMKVLSGKRINDAGF